jgi:hypothetical protein
MGMRMGDLDRWARAHHGVISMEASGLTRSSWYRAIRSGQLDQLHPGVARLHGTADTAEQRIAAAVLAVGMPALASHRSAARLWGIERPTGDPVDVIVAGRRRLPALRGVVIHRPKDLERLSPPQRRSNIVCTNILRTLLDLGAVDRAAVPDAVGHAIAHHHITLPTLESVVIQHSDAGGPGSWRCATPSTPGRSTANRPTRCSRPPCSGSSTGTDSHRSSSIRSSAAHEVDFRVIGTPVILECDGWAYHGLQRTTFERDRDATPTSSERDGSSCASPTGRSPFTRNRPQTASPQPSPGGVEL